VLVSDRFVNAPDLAPALQAACTILDLDFETLEARSGVPERQLRRFVAGAEMPTHSELHRIWKVIVAEASAVLPTPIDETKR
jgi:hypothetical protein